MRNLYYNWHLIPKTIIFVQLMKFTVLFLSYFLNSIIKSNEILKEKIIYYIKILIVGIYNVLHLLYGTKTLENS